MHTHLGGEGGGGCGCVCARCITVRVEDLESAIYIAGVPPCVVLCLHFHLDDLLTLYPSEHCGIRRAVFSAGAETPPCLSICLYTHRNCNAGIRPGTGSQRGLQEYLRPRLRQPPPPGLKAACSARENIGLSRNLRTGNAHTPLQISSGGRRSRSQQASKGRSERWRCPPSKFYHGAASRHHAQQLGQETPIQARKSTLLDETSSCRGDGFVSLRIELVPGFDHVQRVHDGSLDHAGSRS